MRWAMSWTDTVKAAALTVLPERTATASRAVAGAPWSWNPHDLWLSRLQPPRARVAPTSMSEPLTPPPQAIAPRN